MELRVWKVVNKEAQTTWNIIQGFHPQTKVVMMIKPYKGNVQYFSSFR